MGLMINNTDISAINFNGVEIERVNFNGIEVWKKVSDFIIEYTSSENPNTVTIEYASEADFRTGIQTINSNNTNINMKAISTNKLSSGNALFFGYKNIVTLDCSELNTSNVTDMTHMFAQMQGATSINIQGMNTSKVTKMTNMFNSCIKVNNLDLSSFNTSNVTDMSGMFQQNWVHTTLDLSSFNFSKVKDMSDMFNGCNALKSIIWPSDCSSPALTDINGLFGSCKGFTSLTLPTLTYANVINLSSLFYGCSNLTNITNINVLKTATKATALNFMFRDMTNLVTLDLSELNFPKATGIHAMFMGDTKLTTLKLPSMLGGTITDGQYFLANCSSLTSVDCDKIDTTKMTSTGHMFYGATKLVTSINMKMTSATYTNMFVNAATASGAKITVECSTNNESLIDNMIATKSANSNVVKACWRPLQAGDVLTADTQVHAIYSAEYLQNRINSLVEGETFYLEFLRAGDYDGLEMYSPARDYYSIKLEDSAEGRTLFVIFSIGDVFTNPNTETITGIDTIIYPERSATITEIIDANYIAEHLLVNTATLG